MADCCSFSKHSTGDKKNKTLPVLILVGADDGDEAGGNRIIKGVIHPQNREEFIASPLSKAKIPYPTRVPWGLGVVCSVHPR